MSERQASYTVDTKSLADLRRDLVDYRAELRHAERVMPVIKAEAEDRVIEAIARARGSTDYLNGQSDEYDREAAVRQLRADPKLLGGNERDRERTLTLALETDVEYMAAVLALAIAQSACEVAACELQIAIDAEQAEHWRIRDKLAVAMMAAEGAVLDAGLERT